MSLQKLYEKHQSQGLVVLGVNTADDKKIAQEYLEMNKVTFPIILDNTAKGWALHEVYEMPGMTAVPLTYLIDREGKVVDAWYGFQQGRAEEAVKKLGLL